MTIRLGIDVGGTNTDAVLVTANDSVAAAEKRPTSEDIVTGVRAAIDAVLADCDPALIRLAMLGTTQCTNAIVQRRGLRRVGVLRIGAPATTAVPPLTGWPADLAEAVLADHAIVEGGSHFDGRDIRALGADAIGELACRWRENGIEAVAITAVFSPVTRDHEDAAAVIVRETLDVPVSCSHEIGSIGLLERENATVLNAALTGVAARVAEGFRRALADSGVEAPAYLSQNDGTLMSFERAVEQPVLTIGSGSTNSLRGGGWLAGHPDGVVVDVGGTTTDLGVLVKGFPRESAAAVEVGGVRTNFRMPDLVSVALGGGTIVRASDNGVALGPDSVGFRIRTEARCFGGATTTLTDIAVALGHELGDRTRVLEHVDPDQAAAAKGVADEQLARSLERIKTRREPITVIAVGGGAFLVPDRLPGALEVERPHHAEVANAIGAAMAEVSGETDRVFDLEGRDRLEMLDEARGEARERAIRSGADPDRVRDVDLEEIALAYLPGNAVRVRARAVGPLAGAGPVATGEQR